MPDRRWLRDGVRSLTRAAGRVGRRTTERLRRGGTARMRYPGDFTGTPAVRYSPVDDDLADPGEVVWAWLPFEEDHSRGKDRPALVIGRDGRWLLALQLSSQDHDLDAAKEARYGRYWVDVGAGGWDARRRPSEARVDRILRLEPAAVRRIGASLPEERFAEVAREVLRHR